MIDYSFSERRGNTSADLLYGSGGYGLTVCHPEPLYIVILSAAKDMGFENAVLLAARV